MKQSNALINSTSPYLLQHAHNPVNWYPWSDDVLEKARNSNKLLLISIGYAACHWCHVMEHECFEDEEVANAMNKHFVCVKVDREELPDVDHYYMSAVQLMGQRGGWPLNIIALPDGRPIWGGTYFPKENWINNIDAVAAFYKDNALKTQEYAGKLEEGIRQVLLTTDVEDMPDVNIGLLKKAVKGWKERWDMEEGGNRGAPKFPMPVNLGFLLNYGHMINDTEALEFVKTTLEKMARGGIYDQLGGGFARYSVDDKWKIPHFEKMLYDNGQLLGIYSRAYQQFGSEEFKAVVYESACFIERELMDHSGAFYSSLDADSEGEEGKFYVWKRMELQQILGKEFQLFAAFYQVNGKGFWEQGNNILLRDEDIKSFAIKHNLSAAELQTKVAGWKYTLLKERQKRIRPGLDDKTLSAWNALTVEGLVEAFKAFNDEYFLALAIQNATFLEKNLMDDKGRLFRNWKNGVCTIEAFSEDYALFISASLALFEVTGDEKWLELAKNMCSFCMDRFYNKEAALFYFSQKDKNSVVLNHFQKEDNVMPSANSVMANNLHRLYLILGRPEYLELVQKMLERIAPYFGQYPMAYANWGSLMLKLTQPYYEVVVCGINANILLKQLQEGYKPNVLWGFTGTESEIPLFKNRFRQGEDLIYVCRNGTCQQPVHTAQEALELMG